MSITPGNRPFSIIIAICKQDHDPKAAGCLGVGYRPGSSGEPGEGGRAAFKGLSGAAAARAVFPAGAWRWPGRICRAACGVRFDQRLWYAISMLDLPEWCFGGVKGLYWAVQI